MTQKSELGAAGEDIATEYLRKNGYKILERNHRKPWGEIDIIAKAHDKTLVFVEVKTVSGIDPLITAEDQMTSAKMTKTKRAAYLYANENEELSKRGWRVDLVAVNIGDNGRSIKHYENI